MSLVKTKTQSNNIAWSENLRPKVGDSVSHNGSEWSSINGINSEPGVGNDWKQIVSESKEVRPIVTVFGNKFFLLKSPLNNNPLNSEKIEVNDFIVDGFFNDSTFWMKAVYTNTNPNSDINLESNWNVLDSYEELINYNE